MLRKFLSVGVGAAMLLAAVLCLAGDKYEEARQLFEEYVPALETYLDAVEKAESAPVCARAINTLADQAEELAPKLRELNRRYPELQHEQTVPPRYGELEKKADALRQRFGLSFLRIARFMEDPAVAKANDRLITVIARLDPAGE
jgi:predicted  nucleic acid-binding Zn-ribbon protein